MIIETKDGPKHIGLAILTPYQLPAHVTAANAAWRNAWNSSAADFNLLVERTQAQFGRMMDVKPLPMIPEDSIEIPGFDRTTGKIAGWND